MFMALGLPVPEAVKEWSNGICRQVDMFRKTEFPTQSIYLRNFPFCPCYYCYLREGKTTAAFAVER